MIASNNLYLLLVLNLVPLLFSWKYSGLAQWAVGFDVLLLLLILVDLITTDKPQVLFASRQINERLSIGRANSVSITVSNQSSVSLEVRLKDDAPPALLADAEQMSFTLPPESMSVSTYNLTPRARGSYVFGNIHLAYLSRLGLYWRQFQVPAKQEIKVFSDLKTLHDLSIKLAHSSELGDQHQRKRGQGTEFNSLKEYTVGDDARNIDWKATARRGRPVVRSYEVEHEQVLLILIDAGRMMVSDLEGLSRFDHALNAALCLALAGLSRNDQVGLGVFAQRPLLYLPPRRGKAQLKRMIEAVFNIQPQLLEPDYQGCLSHFANLQKSRCLMAVITDLTDVSGSQALVSGLSNLANRHLPFCITLKDRQVESLATGTVHNATDIYRQAVSCDLLLERQLALSVLTHRGCLVLDCAAQDLSEKIVDRYLEIKAGGKI